VSTNSANFDETLRSLGEGAPEALSVHPDYRDLGDYVSDALSPAMTEAVQEHLAYCARCADVVLELMEPSSPPESIPAPEPTGTATGRLSYRLPLAAAIAVAALGSLWWFFVRVPANAPQVLNLTANLEDARYADALGVQRGGLAIELRLGEEPSIWGLQPAKEPAHVRYRVLIRKQSGRSIWKSSLEPVTGPPDYFYLRLTPNFFPPGEYRIEITGWRGSAHHQLGVWPLLVSE